MKLESVFKRSLKDRIIEQVSTTEYKDYYNNMVFELNKIRKFDRGTIRNMLRDDNDRDNKHDNKSR